MLDRALRAFFEFRSIEDVVANPKFYMKNTFLTYKYNNRIYQALVGYYPETHHTSMTLSYDLFRYAFRTFSPNSIELLSKDCFKIKDSSILEDLPFVASLKDKLTSPVNIYYHVHIRAFDFRFMKPAVKFILTPGKPIFVQEDLFMI